MTLSDLIRGNLPAQTVATATAATSATDNRRGKPLVATVAPVSVAGDGWDADGPFAAADEAAVRAWLASIGENDSSLVEKIIHYCKTDSRSRVYFLGESDRFSIRNGQLKGGFL